MSNRKAAAIGKSAARHYDGKHSGSGALPDTIKFLLVLGVLAGVIYGGVVALATFPPEQSEIIKPLPHEKLRQK